MTNIVEYSVLEKVIVAQLVMKLPIFYGSVDKILRELLEFGLRSNSLRPILVLSSHLTFLV
jgi:hypothetical protein